ncbi:MAG: GTPase [Dysosmobacter welbionis]
MSKHQKRRHDYRVRRPNVGKSSLTNALVGKRWPSSPTRHRPLGTASTACEPGDTQYILLDTPGLHKPKSALGTTW